MTSGSTARNLTLEAISLFGGVKHLLRHLNPIVLAKAARPSPRHTVGARVKVYLLSHFPLSIIRWPNKATFSPSYRSGIQGQGRANLGETGLGAFSLFPELMKQYGYKTPFDFPVGVNKGVASPLRSFQLKPQRLVVTEDVLRFIDDLRVQGLDKKP